MFTREQVMSWDTLRRIIAELVRIKYKGRVHPYGNGEPLTDPTFTDKVRYIRECLPQCFMYIATNGDFIDKPHSFRNLGEAGINQIQCNHYDDKNANLREKPTTEIVKRNGKKYVVGIEHMNLGDLRTTFYNRAGNTKIENITPSKTCWFPGVKLYFNYLGDMLVCCADWTFKDKIGNINDQSLEELVASPKLRQYREYLAHDRADELPLCSQCNLIRHHKGGL